MDELIKETILETFTARGFEVVFDEEKNEIIFKKNNEEHKFNLKEIEKFFKSLEKRL